MKTNIKSIDTSVWAVAAEAFREFGKLMNELPEDVKQALRRSGH